jgi:hypothetical protein
MRTDGKPQTVDPEEDSVRKTASLNIVVCIYLTDNPLDVFKRYIFGSARDVANPLKDSLVSIHSKIPPNTFLIAGTPHAS